ncbi:MAG: hypothetical protein ACM309_12430 [Bacillota bacterium]
MAPYLVAVATGSRLGACLAAAGVSHAAAACVRNEAADETACRGAACVLRLSG